MIEECYDICPYKVENKDNEFHCTKNNIGLKTHTSYQSSNFIPHYCFLRPLSKEKQNKIHKEYMKNGARKDVSVYKCDECLFESLHSEQF